MKILVIAPNLSGPPTGNRITATRWKKILQGLGHQVALKEKYTRERTDLLIALHATKSHSSVKLFKQRNPGKPIVVGLAGTDLYIDLKTTPATQETLWLADAIISLQPLAKEALSPTIARKVAVIYQSAVPPKKRLKPLPNCFELCLIANLRDVKDPFLAEEASRLLPPNSMIKITHIGSAYSPAWEQEARTRAQNNKRYRWLGPQGHARTLQLLERAQAVLLTSKSEGGANVVSEALACRKPLLCSEIPGTVGILGEDYPGYFPPGNTRALTDLMMKAENEEHFLLKLKRAIKRKNSLVNPKKEQQAWQKLLQRLHFR